MGKIKLKFLTISIVAILFTILTQGTLAYYTTVGQATNVVSSGNVRFIINEKTDSGTDFPKEGVYIVPGDVVGKKVNITSDCEHPFYLRAKILYGINAEDLPSEECFKLNINEEHWILKDGWYYYKDVVEPYQTTEDIFSHVEIVGSKMDNAYLGKTLTLTVDAQAVQSENNPTTDNAYEANGWPAE